MLNRCNTGSRVPEWAPTKRVFALTFRNFSFSV